MKNRYFLLKKWEIQVIISISCSLVLRRGFLTRCAILVRYSWTHVVICRYKCIFDCLFINIIWLPWYEYSSWYFYQSISACIILFEHKFSKILFANIIFWFAHYKKKNVYMINKWCSLPHSNILTHVMCTI